ncbi:hypothetical protein BDV41DRAFT_554348 [Aspergillus transmontanensis]|uniref:Uncharacterized protein n=1 Tax=Aspergillus transmontanensis TaxID=1034304 RepID=A0A5N6VGX7_9EURO|nr:hypothetical protein BDV41DRAFT_554348 [Aspergillus transmontanensis]
MMEIERRMPFRRYPSDTSGGLRAIPDWDSLDITSPPHDVPTIAVSFPFLSFLYLCIYIFPPLFPTTKRKRV